MRPLGINFTTAAFGLSYAEKAALIKSAGFDCVFTGMRKPDDAEVLCRAIADAGLRYESIHAPFDRVNEIWCEGEVGEEVTAELLDCVRYCGDHRIPILVVHLSSGENAPCVNDLGHRRWDAVVNEAVKRGVTVAFENQRLLANLAFVLELYRNIPEVGFCWDVGHEKCFAHGREYMPLFGDRLVYTHIHDNRGEFNKDLHMIPFDADIDFHHVADQIKASGFGGTLTLEVIPEQAARYEGSSIYDDWSAEQYYTHAADAARRLRAMIE